MSLYGSFEIGKKALAASQMGQATTGHNIANVDTEGFSRQELSQAAAKPGSDGKGTGVDITGIRRKQDGFTKQKVVDEQTLVGSWETRDKILTEAEVIYTDLEGTRLAGAMNEFWSSWNSVATEPESVTLRKTLVTKAEELAQDFRAFDKRLTEFNDSLNGRIVAELHEINQITGEISMMNKQVEQLEKRGLPANDARDRRELLLQQLSQKVEVRWFESKRGTMEVQIANGQHLVHGRDNYELTPLKSVEAKGDIRLALNSSAGVQADVTDTIKNGGLKELINQRDGNIKQYKEDLNLMVNELAFRVNSIHGNGTGINGAKYTETGAYILDKEERQNPLPFLKSGAFEIKLINEHKEIEEVYTINLQAGVDTIETVIDKINREAGAYETVGEGDQKKEVLKEITPFKAELTPDGIVKLSAGMGKQFIYGEDNTDLKPILGLNCFFHLTNGARDIQVNQEFVEDEMKIVAGTDLIPGDNRVALAIAELQYASTMNDETTSFNEFYNAQITDIGLKVVNAQKGLRSHSQMLEQYEALRDSVSSVNLDEEMTKMVKYQRAYESSAKFLSTVDQMTQTVINM
ncbi:MAG: flagellar hook-associated protein FlgK [Deltaproteobacteria bacterium]|jgi:flagellar hook-associated protein 1|nr:flagellar hook-associated protein FlgK [Deltaproteobacteria bacterium]MBT4265192.1 flagellar hook-associated protein FlgK [Deltaproteobacteria bacterium]MBT4638617.1 flagellar hook-associated protein FlgK [Deltaproteobacteria bacterium]MBT6611604.1 flagellar hook-associated protein FlgK [Deltaproteobacteria bacterium]MBT7152275.1 flagellar hook-associated protein FlgK [Deltaproteobacteria bacterium]